jgi:thioesterase domain-containing protein
MIPMIAIVLGGGALAIGMTVAQTRRVDSSWAIRLVSVICRRSKSRSSGVPQSDFACRSDRASSIENDGGWGTFGPTEVHVVPGDHFTMPSEPYGVVLAEKLEAYLSQIQPSQ